VHRTVSDAPGRSTPNLPPSGFWKLPSAIIHRTVRCSTGLSGVPSGATATAPTVVCKSNSEQWTVRDYARRVRAGTRRRTRQWTVTVRCTTGLSGGPTCQSSNGRTLTVGWHGWHTGQCPVAHRTVRCAIRQQPFPTATLVVGAINTPQPPHFKASKFSANTFNTRARAFNTRHK
jgi:hypothetical protein